MSKTFADQVVRMAFDTKVMSASNDINYKPKLPISGEAPRGAREPTRAQTSEASLRRRRSTGD
jgi:hypothetical protein